MNVENIEFDSKHFARFVTELTDAYGEPEVTETQTNVEMRWNGENDAVYTLTKFADNANVSRLSKN